MRVIAVQNLHPCLGIHLKKSNLVTGNIKQRSMRSSSLMEEKKLQNAWATDNGMNTVYLTREKQHSSMLGLLADFETASVPTGKQQRSCCPFWSILFWVLVESYPDVFSQCCAAAFRSLFAIYRSLESGTRVPCFSSWGETLCHSKSVRRAAAPHPRPPGLADVSKQI